MMHRKLLAGSSFLLALAAFNGCSADGSSDADLSSPPTSDGPGASLPPPSGTGTPSANASDAGAKPPKDASAPVLENAPATGAACNKRDEIYARACGACGKQEAICTFSSDDAGAGVVSEYSACHDEAGVCVPGATMNETCGNCGTHTKTCNKYCSWTASACTGEPAESCPAGMVAWSTAGCPQSGTFRSRACSDACTWGSYASSCTAPNFEIGVAGAVGQTAQAVVPLVNAIKTRLATGKCPAATIATDGDHAVAFVNVVNRTGKKATLSAWNGQTKGGPLTDTALAVYTAQPTTDAALAACEKGVGATCDSSKLPCDDGRFGSLTDADSIVLNAGESRVVAVFAEQPVGQMTEGPIVLIVRTDALQ